MLRAATKMPSANEAARAAHVDRRGRVQEHCAARPAPVGSRRAPRSPARRCPPARLPRARRRSSPGRGAPDRSSTRSPRRFAPRARACIRAVRSRPSPARHAPRARAPSPSSASAPAMRSMRAGFATPTTWRPALAGLAERTEQVHDRGNPDLAPHRRDVAHCRMHRRREHEHDARVIEHALHHRGRRLDVDAERLEHIGAAAPRAVRPIAVLRDPHPRARGDEGRRGRDVERRERSAAGAAGVDERRRVRRRRSGSIAVRSARAPPATS